MLEKLEELQKLISQLEEKHASLLDELNQTKTLLAKETESNSVIKSTLSVLESSFNQNETKQKELQQANADVSFKLKEKNKECKDLTKMLQTLNDENQELRVKNQITSQRVSKIISQLSSSLDEK